MLPQLNDDERLYLQTIFDYFHEHENWPTYRYIDRKLTRMRRNLDIEKIAKSLPPGFASTYAYNLLLNDEAMLSISALYVCEGSEEELNNFFTVLNYCVEKYFNAEEDTVQVTSDELSQHLDMSQSSVYKVGLLIRSDNYAYTICDRFGGPNSENRSWDATLSRRIREFNGITSIKQYLEKLEKQQEVLLTPGSRNETHNDRTGLSMKTVPSLAQNCIEVSDQYNLSEDVKYPLDKLEIFLCYAHEDEALRYELEKHLRVLRRQNLITVWHDRDISAGTEWEQEIGKHLSTAHIVLLLVSPDFMDSDYCYGVEMRHAIERHERGETQVIPIILRPVYWQEAPFSKFQVLPTNGEPVVSSAWHTTDEAFLDIVNGILTVINKLLDRALTTDIKSVDALKTTRDNELTYKKAMEDWKRVELYSAYKVIRRLVGAYETLYATIERELGENLVQTAQDSLINVMKDAEEVQGAYALVGKEEEIHAALQALYSAYISWAETRKIFYSLKDRLHPSVDPLTIMPYETVKRAKEQFESKRDILLTLVTEHVRNS